MFDKQIKSVIVRRDFQRMLLELLWDIPDNYGMSMYFPEFNKLNLSDVSRDMLSGIKNRDRESRFGIFFPWMQRSRLTALAARRY